MKDLFGNEVRLPVVNNKSRESKKEKPTCRKSVASLYKMDLFGGLKTEGRYEMPIIEAYNGSPPKRLVPFNVAMANKDYDCCVHFYIDDALFVKLWRQPVKYLPFLKKCQSVISPDFSQYVDFPFALRLINAYWNRAFAAWLQQMGVNVICNVTWSRPDSYAYSFAGIPHNSTIAINCNGVKQHNMSQYLWKKGYDKAISTLSPSCIIRYGSVMQGERTDISYYYENEIIKRMRYGSKR